MKKLICALQIAFNTSRCLQKVKKYYLNLIVIKIVVFKTNNQSLTRTHYWFENLQE